MEPFGSFLLAAIALTGSPGPNTLSLAAVGAAYGRRRGFRYMIGMNFGMALVIAMMGSGISTLVFALPGVAPVVTALAAAYFLYLAYRIATAPPVSEDGKPGREPRWYEGTTLSLVNPKAYAAMAALFSGFNLMDGAPFGDGLLKAAVLMATIIAVNFFWLTVGATPDTVFPRPAPEPDHQCHLRRIADRFRRRRRAAIIRRQNPGFVTKSGERICGLTAVAIAARSATRRRSIPRR